MRRRRPLSIAVAGIDGSGKSALARDLTSQIKERYGLRTGRISLPRYQQSWRIPKYFGRKLKRIEEVGNVKGRRENVLLAWLGAASLYPYVKIPAEKNKDVMVVERHPFVDAPVYAKVYGIERTSPILRFLTAAGVPQVVVFIKTNPKAALKRIRKRPKAFQLHENETKLREIDRAYKETLSKLRERGVRVITVSGDKTTHDTLVETMRILNRKGILKELAREKRRK